MWAPGPPWNKIWDVRAQIFSPGVLGPSVDGINLATPKGFYSKSRKSKNSNKNLKLYTSVHLPARIDAIFKKITLTLQAQSAREGCSGGVMGSNVDFKEIALKPEE